jgi:hypothetical protein
LLYHIFTGDIALETVEETGTVTLGVAELKSSLHRFAEDSLYRVVAPVAGGFQHGGNTPA